MLMCHNMYHCRSVGTFALKVGVLVYSSASHYQIRLRLKSFRFDEENTQSLSDLFNTKKSHLEFDIALIKDETGLPNEMSGALWKRLISDCNFMVLQNIVPRFLCMFGSTYVCESTFSSLARRKNKFRSSLSQDNLESDSMNRSLITIN